MGNEHRPCASTMKYMAPSCTNRYGCHTAEKMHGRGETVSVGPVDKGGSREGKGKRIAQALGELGARLQGTPRRSIDEMSCKSGNLILAFGLAPRSCNMDH